MMNLLQSIQNKKDNQNQSKGRTEKGPDNIHISPIAAFVAVIFYLIAVFGAMWMDQRAPQWFIIAWTIGFTVLGTYLLFAIKVAQQWEKAVVLRLGKFHGLRGPGMFWMIPILDATPVWIDHRVVVTPFNAEKSLTMDATQLHPLPDITHRIYLTTSLNRQPGRSPARITG